MEKKILQNKKTTNTDGLSSPMLFGASLGLCKIDLNLHQGRLVHRLDMIQKGLCTPGARKNKQHENVKYSPVNIFKTIHDSNTCSIKGLNRFTPAHSSKLTYFRMSVGQFEVLLRMLAPHLRRQHQLPGSY